MKFCPTIKTEINTTTDMRRENSLRQFNYSMPLGMNVMGNWVPFTFTVLMTPTSGYHAIVTPVPDSHCWFYKENYHEYICHNQITSWEDWYEEVMDICDYYRDSDGNLHKPKQKVLHRGPVNLMTYDTVRSGYTGTHYYKAGQTLLPDGAVCRPDCWGSYSETYEPDLSLSKQDTIAETKKTGRKHIKDLPANRIRDNRRNISHVKNKVAVGCSTCGR